MIRLSEIGLDSAPKKGRGLALVHPREPLRELAAFVTPSSKGVLGDVAADVAGVLEAAEGSPYPSVPSLAAERFNRLAEQATLRFHAGPPVAGSLWPGVFLQLAPEVAVGIHTSEGRHVGARGLWAFQLAFGYFANPARERLRRCTQCRRWFVDATKNRSARRCSTQCTVKWSNKHRRSRSKKTKPNPVNQRLRDRR